MAGSVLKTTLTKVVPISTATMVLSAFVFLNLDGGERWWPSRQHGWPIVVLQRSPVRTVVGPFAQIGPSSRWPFDNAEWTQIKYHSIAINALIICAVTLDAFLWSRWIAKNRFPMSITKLMEITFGVAVVVSCPLFSGLELYEFTATLIAVSCLTITSIRIVHLTGGKIVRYVNAKSSERRSENELR